ncbi:MAG: hypothetical protein ACOX6T_24325, partial [Myxococcales bacterium]
KRGTEVAALFYSLVETAKLSGVNPRDYLRTAVDAALRGDAPPAPRARRLGSQPIGSSARAVSSQRFRLRTTL